MTTKHILFCAFFGIIPVLASPVAYIMQFNTVAGSPAPTSGAFTYDSATATFSGFTIQWNGNTFDFTQFANGNGVFVTRPSCVGSSAVYGEAVFTGLTSANCTHSLSGQLDPTGGYMELQIQAKPSAGLGWTAFNHPGFSSPTRITFGAYYEVTVASLATPEPTSLTGVALGLAAFSVIRRRRNSIQ